MHIPCSDVRHSRAKCLTHLPAIRTLFLEATLYPSRLRLRLRAREAAIYPESPFCHLADFLPSPTLSILISFFSGTFLRTLFLVPLSLLSAYYSFSAYPSLDVWILSARKQLLAYPFIRLTAADLLLRNITQRCDRLRG